jgi:N-acetylated-alpha-linked acidic dipeptidase
MTVRNSLAFLLLWLVPAALSAQSAVPTIFGYPDFTAQAKIEATFLAVPDAQLAGQHLRILTAEPHLAATPEDRKTAEYVAEKFRQAGLDTEIVPYRVLLNQPRVVRVEAFDEAGHQLMTGPSREHVPGDPYQDDPRVVMPFNGSSGSGDVTGDVVYANYGRIEDFDQLAAQQIDLQGKIVICRYGANFRGVKAYLAQQRGAAGILIYSDPQDDGYFKGDAYPNGPWRPETGIQRGSVQFLFQYPGDPETPGVASTLDLPDSARISPEGNQPHIVSIPISYYDAAPILKALKGPGVPTGWQGALPFRYHLGQVAAQPGGKTGTQIVGKTGAESGSPASAQGSVKVHLVSQQDYQRRIIWDVIGKIPGSTYPDEWVIVGNHRDAWVYGAVDPNSGTAAMLESVHGVGVLLKQHWRPKRTIIFASWDAEEEGLIGSTEWVEQYAKPLERAVAYFNTDVAVSGTNFSASSVPSLKQFIREVTRSVPSPAGLTVYDQWKTVRPDQDEHRVSNPSPASEEVHIGELGSGSDFTPFLQHVGVPSTDIGSEGPYGVYHSVFDNFAWFIQNADPHFLYLQEMARVLGLEAVRMADADVLPYNYVAYAHSISSYLEAAKKRATDNSLATLDFAPALAAAARFSTVAKEVRDRQIAPTGDLAKLNLALRQTETALISEAGLPNRPWYRHTIYAPGQFTGYAAVAIPGVNEAIDAKDQTRAAQQLAVLTHALDRAADTLDSVH